MARFSLFGLFVVLCVTARTPSVGAEGARLSFPAVTCAGETAAVAFSWEPAAGAGVQWLDITLLDNGFAPGTFLGAGPLAPDTRSVSWAGIVKGLPHLWRVNVLTPSGWVTSATGAFVPCGGAALLNVPIACTAAGTATVRFRWAPAAPAAGQQWLDLTLFDNGFAPGTFLGAGPLAGDAQEYVWSGIRTYLPHLFRINGLSSSGWTPAAAGSFVARCPPPEANVGDRRSPFSLYPGLYVLDLGSGTLRRLSDDRGNVLDLGAYLQTVAWSPDGLRLAVARGQSGIAIYRARDAVLERELPPRTFAVDWLPSGRLGLYSEDSGSDQVLLDPESGSLGRFWPDLAFGASWSPDGRYIAHAVPSYRPGGGGLYILDTATGEDRRLAAGEFGPTAWSPQGGLIAAQKLGAPGESASIVVLDALTGAEVARFPWGNDLAWSPDGRWLASTVYSEEDGYRPLIRLQAADGSSLRPLIRGQRATWSPDGGRIAFLRDGQLWHIDVETGVESPLLRPQLPVVEEPRWSPAGDLLAFRAGGGPGGVYVIGADGGNERYLAPGFSARWSPRGDRIGFMFGQGGLGFAGAIYTMTGGATEIRRLGPVSYGDAIPICTSGHQFQWAPDASAIAFWRQPQMNEDSIFVVPDQDGAQPRGVAKGTGPAWSPDGKRLAFTSANLTGPGPFPCEVRTVSKDGGPSSAFASGLIGPVWSPDGTRIAAQAYGSYGALPKIAVLATDGSGARTEIPGTGPVWSPDGQRLAFRRNVNPAPTGTIVPPGASQQILVAKRDGSDERVLLEVRNLGTFVWSPDGQRIAYSAHEDIGGGWPSIFIISVDGSGPSRRLTSGSDPSWSPDGSWIAFTR